MPLDTPVAIIATDNPDAARAFYEETLGLTFIRDEPFALVFRTGSIQLRVTKLEEHTPAPGTVFGWEVPDIAAAIGDLQERGVSFERFPGMPQDELGVWTTPGGSAKVAWFKDPSGNLLSLTECD